MEVGVVHGKILVTGHVNEWCKHRGSGNWACENTHGVSVLMYEWLTLSYVIILENVLLLLFLF